MPPPWELDFVQQGVCVLGAKRGQSLPADQVAFAVSSGAVQERV